MISLWCCEFPIASSNIGLLIIHSNNSCFCIHSKALCWMRNGVRLEWKQISANRPLTHWSLIGFRASLSMFKLMLIRPLVSEYARIWPEICVDFDCPNNFNVNSFINLFRIGMIHFSVWSYIQGNWSESFVSEDEWRWYEY